MRRRKCISVEERRARLSEHDGCRFETRARRLPRTHAIRGAQEEEVPLWKAAVRVPPRRHVSPVGLRERVAFLSLLESSCRISAFIDDCSVTRSYESAAREFHYHYSQNGHAEANTSVFMKLSAALNIDGTARTHKCALCQQ